MTLTTATRLKTDNRMTKKLNPNSEEFITTEGYTPSQHRIPQVECPLCEGYGGTYPNAFSNVYCNCPQCNGWGWVATDSLDVTCIHEDVELTPEQCNVRGIHHFGNCYHVYICKKCGRSKSIDSSG